MQARLVEFLFLVLIAVLGLSACATKSMHAGVFRLHEFAPPEGRTFAITATDPAKEGGVEIQQYANLVSFYLEREGFRRTFGETPDFTVKIDYSISEPIQQTRRSSDHNYYYANETFLFNNYSALFQPYTYTYTFYDVALMMVIARADGEVVFEGLAEGFPRERIPNEVMVPALIEAMFTNFPGRSGETITVKLPVSQEDSFY